MTDSEPEPKLTAADGTSHSKTSDHDTAAAPPRANNSAGGGGAKSELPPPVPPVDTVGGGGGEDDDMLLVTEFPPPPYYYHLASRQTPAHLRLVPPDVPRRAFRVAAKKVGAERRKAREESERLRLEAESEGGSGAVLGGDTNKAVRMEVETPEAAEAASSGKQDDRAEATAALSSLAENHGEEDSIDPDDPNEPVVAVFGEIVEDPTLVIEEECHDPVEIRENVKRLNTAVLNGFLKLVQKLVHDPNDNKKLRDELSHNLFRMLEECNKFREHQAREILIDTLEQQLERREEGLALLQRQIGEADAALAALQNCG